MSSAKKPVDLNQNGTPETADAPPALPADLRRWEAQLAEIRPRDDRLNRDRLMFEAGRAAGMGELEAGHAARGRGERGEGRENTRGGAGWGWPAATAAMTAVAASLAVALALRGDPPVVQRVQIVEIPAAESVTGAEERALAQPVAPAELARADINLDATGHEPGRRTTWLQAESAGRPAAVPSGGLDFRLFEHLMQERTVPISVPAKHGPGEESPTIMSPRSLPLLLDQSARRAAFAPVADGTHSLSPNLTYQEIS